MPTRMVSQFLLVNMALVVPILVLTPSSPLRGQTQGKKGQPNKAIQQLKKEHADMERALKVLDKRVEGMSRFKMEADQLRRQNALLQQQIQDLNKRLTESEFRLNQLSSAFPNPPDLKREGKVTSTANGQVMVSLGKKDGLLPGHTLEVYRTAKGEPANYVGSLRILQVRDKSAVTQEFRYWWVRPAGIGIQSGDIVNAKVPALEFK